MKTFKQLREELDYLDEMKWGTMVRYSAKAAGSALSNAGKAAAIGFKQHSVKAAYSSAPAQKVINRTVGLHRAAGFLDGKVVRNSMNKVRLKMTK